MVEFILILTMVADTSQTGHAIDHISGFGTQAECLQAGNDWLKQMREADSPYPTVRPRAVCVKQTHSAGASRDE